MNNYKKDQKKTRALLKAWKLIKDYEFNSDRNRAMRRKRPKDQRRFVGRNVQTFIKKKRS